MKPLLKYAFLTLFGAILYSWAHNYAYEIRGYTDYGVECILLFLPVYWWIGERVREIWKGSKP